MRAALVLTALLLVACLAPGAEHDPVSPSLGVLGRTAQVGLHERPLRPVWTDGRPELPRESGRPKIALPSAPLILVRRDGGSDGAWTQRRTRGLASWYDDGPGLYAAAHSFRWGDTRYRVRVCADQRCVVVTVRDHCQCYVGTDRERVIDLSPDAFSRLAPLSRGVVKVTVTWQ